MIRQLAVLLAACFSLALMVQAQATPTIEPIQEFQGTIADLAPKSPDDCGWESEAPPNISADTTKLENKLFDQADAAIVEALNTSAATPAETTSRVLKMMQNISSTANQTWPDNRRFHYELLVIDPVLVVKFRIRSRSTFSVFAVPEHPRYPSTKKEWLRVGGDEQRWGEHNSDESIDLYELARGPAKFARFLSKSSHVSCGDGQTGIQYIGYEWNPSWIGDLLEVLRRKGAVSGEVFPAIGKLQTKETRITLPYCWWSSIDSSVWATLCSVDTYDLSRSHVRFLNTKTNRPDLETVAKVIEYAQARDLPAVASYSTSAAVANKLTALMPPSVYNAGQLPSEPAGDRQTVDIEDGHHLRFVLVRRGERWLVADFLIIQE